MRTLSAPLLAAQKGATCTPYVTITMAVGKGGGTSYTYATTDSPSRLKSVKLVENPYSDSAIIVLRNNDKSITTNFLGMYTTVTFGYNIGGTPTVPDELGPAPMWVKRQFQLSRGGDTDIVLYLQGCWSMLSERFDIGSLLGGTRPYYEVDYSASADHVYDVISAVIVAAGFSMVALGTHDDGIVESLQPDYVVNSVPFDSYYVVLYRLLDMTRLFGRFERSAGADLAQFRLLYPYSYSDFHRTFTSDQTGSDYQFKNFEWTDHLLNPTHVWVVAHRVNTADGVWNDGDIDVGEYSMATENSYPDIVQYHIAETLDSEVKADARAKVIAIRQWMEESLGRIVVQHDCGLELYDYVKIRDKRGAGTYTDYPTAKWSTGTEGKLCVVGSLTHVFAPGVYDLEITLNGIESELPVDKAVRPKTTKDIKDEIVQEVGGGGVQEPTPVPARTLQPSPEPFRPILQPARYGGSPAAWNAFLSLATGGGRVREDIRNQAIVYGARQANLVQSQRVSSYLQSPSYLRTTIAGFQQELSKQTPGTAAYEQTMQQLKYYNTKLASAVLKQAVPWMR